MSAAQAIASQNITLTASAYSGAECGTCFGHTAQ